MKIQIQNLSKIYNGGKPAIDNINIEIESGLFGLLGPNGAGKTTLMRILVTLMKPSSGSVLINDLDLQKERKEIRSMIGYLPQEFSTFPKMKTWEFLDYSARLAGIKLASDRNDIVDKFLDQVGLFDARDRLASKLSGGMKRRLGIAQALIGDPKVLVVDEPTTGLDPEERIRFRNLLTKMSEEERIIILSTHIVGDISSTCSDMALLVEGHVGFHGSPSELIKQARGFVFEIDANTNDLTTIQEKYAVISTIPSESGWKVQVVAKNTGKYPSISIDPNLEHAYVHFIDQYYDSEKRPDLQELDFKDD